MLHQVVTEFFDVWSGVHSFAPTRSPTAYISYTSDAIRGGCELQLRDGAPDSFVGIRVNREEFERRTESDRLSAAIEEASHLFCALYTGHHDRKISLWELEMLAEVHRFFTLEAGGEDSDYLYRTLFGGLPFEEGLSPEEKVRYASAEVYAGQFVRHVLRIAEQVPTHPTLIGRRVVREQIDELLRVERRKSHIDTKRWKSPRVVYRG